MTLTRVRAFAPATVSNVACGFDILGFALEGLGDEVVVERTEEPGVTLSQVTGDDGRLPRQVTANTASVAVQALLDRLGSSAGLRLELHKGMPLSSGLGSSAASAVAAVWAAHRLLEADLSREALLECALEGEKVACGALHADNAAPALYGGLVLVRNVAPPDIVSLPVPPGMTCAVVRPHVEVETRASRALLGDTLRLQDAVTQWANVAGLVAGLYTEDWGLMQRSLHDVVAEPVRSGQVPGFGEVKKSALVSGALGCSLSGSGPSIFALCRDRDTAQRVSRAMAQALGRSARLDCDCIVSPIHPTGAGLVEEGSGGDAGLAV